MPAARQLLPGQGGLKGDRLSTNSSLRCHSDCLIEASSIFFSFAKTVPRKCMNSSAKPQTVVCPKRFASWSVHVATKVSQCIGTTTLPYFEPSHITFRPL
ncbi:hypothetical protein AAHC03_01413 [Spirometra sp. Aus1]